MLGIIGALREETDGLIALMDDVKIKKVGGFEYSVGNLFGKPVAVCKCGVGKVYSAAACAVMAAAIKPNYIINIGVAGGRRGLKRGDTVISQKTVQHDFNAVADGMPMGQLYGFSSPFFGCDKVLYQGLEVAALKLNIPYIKGTVASGDIFVSDAKMAENITKRFGADAYDMESAAINQVCELFGIGFCAIRSISDNGDEAAIGSFYEFLRLAADRSIKLISEFIKNN